MESKKKIKVIPLGGLGEIGKNITVIEYGDEIVVVDCGMTFPDSEMYGIDVVIPDLTYLDNNIEKVHVKNTGKCKELLIPNCVVYLEESDNPNRKTKYSLISVQKNDRLINMDSQVPNKVVYEGLINNKIVLPGLDEEIIHIKPEKTYENSRFDIYLETENKKVFIEV